MISAPSSDLYSAECVTICRQRTTTPSRSERSDQVHDEFRRFVRERSEYAGCEGHRVLPFWAPKPSLTNYGVAEGFSILSKSRGNGGIFASALENLQKLDTITLRHRGSTGREEP